MSDYIRVRDYAALFRSLDAEFNKLLGIETAYVEGRKSNSILVKQLREFASRAEEFDRRPDLKQIQSLNMEFLRLRGLYRNASCALTVRNNLAPKLTKKLLDSDEGNFYGARLELHIAAQLVMRNIQFGMPDPPDFRISQDGNDVTMECTSKHLVRPIHELAVFQRKVEDTIREKAAKCYCDLNCALIIDIANLQAHGTDDGHLLESPTSFTDFVASVQRNEPIRFGAIIGVTWYYTPETQTLTSGFVRHDEPDAAIPLIALLDQLFPCREQATAVQDTIVPIRT